MTEKRILYAILIATLLLGLTYAIKTPVFEASDELWHYPMVRHLADGNPLPVQVIDPAQAGPWKQEASQPPLYYYLGAALTFWVDTSDMDQVRRLNPHVDTGVIKADGNINLVVRDPAQSPWQGTLLAVRIVRLASVLMGLVTVYFTYRIAREVWPGRPVVALGAAAVNAFTPMFLFISGAVNNDNLAMMLASWALFLMIRCVKSAGNREDTQIRPRRWLGLGAIIGLAALTKEGTLGLIPMALGAAAIVSWQRVMGPPEKGPGAKRPRLSLALLAQLARGTLLRFAIILGPVLLIAGWWYVRNIALYGDWLGWNAFIAVLGQRPQPATLAQLWDERWGFLASYWGLFGGVNVPMPTWIYMVLNGVIVVAVPGFLVYVAKSLADWRATYGRIALRIETVFDFTAFRFALVVCLLFSVAVVYGLISWATTTWSSQGRLAFTAISTLSTLLALGLYGWLPRRPAQIVAAGAGAFLLVTAAAAPFLWIAPAYMPSQASPPAPLQPVDITFGGRMKLEGYAVEPVGEAESLHPGDAVDVFLKWRTLEAMSRDWSVFVHLNDPLLQTPLAQRDMYPGGGLLVTSSMEPGITRIERYRLTVPQTALAPAPLELAVGLYDYQTNRRLMSEQGDAVVLERLELQSAAGDTGRQLEINFGNELALVNYELPLRRLAPGASFDLALTWSPVRSLRKDYTFFAQVLNDADTTRWAAYDMEAATSRWETGSEHTITLPMVLHEETPPGVYTIFVGVYIRGEDGGFNRLQIVRDGRITMDDVLQLTRIRIE